MGYTYTALAESENRIGQNVGAYGASYNSQYEATNNAMRSCRTAYSDCVLVYEGSRYVYVSQAEKNRIKIETALKDANKKAKEENINSKNINVIMINWSSIFNLYITNHDVDLVSLDYQLYRMGTLSFD